MGEHGGGSSEFSGYIMYAGIIVISLLCVYICVAEGIKFAREKKE
jgi:hypothetical protein